MVGLRYNVAKTEYLLIGNWSVERLQNLRIHVFSCTILNEVQDFKYLHR